jgi:hypothetical protein
VGITRADGIDHVYRIGGNVQRRRAAVADPGAVAIQAADQRQVTGGGIALRGLHGVAGAAQRGHFVTVERQQGVAVAEHGEEIFAELGDARAGIDQTRLVERHARQPLAQRFAVFARQLVAAGVDQGVFRQRQRGQLRFIPLAFATGNRDEGAFAVRLHQRQAPAVVHLAVAQQHLQPQFAHGGFDSRAPFAVANRHAVDHRHFKARQRARHVERATADLPRLRLGFDIFAAGRQAGQRHHQIADRAPNHQDRCYSFPLTH